tara:strand:+ start:1920 stop:2459 length:540 start_codon:yes stop_codon:yes gene_type:complete
MSVWYVIDHTEIGTGGAASWNETSISASYDHLCLRASLRTERADYYEDGKINFNGDTGSNYSLTRLLFGGGETSMVSERQSSQTKLGKWDMTGASAEAECFGTLSLWIPYYANTANYKSCFIQWGANDVSNATTEFSTGILAGMWASTAAINQITIATNDGEDIAEHSSFTLYGINGAG